VAPLPSPTKSPAPSCSDGNISTVDVGLGPLSVGCCVTGAEVGGLVGF
jgi:hypothetical protein